MLSPLPVIVCHLVYYAVGIRWCWPRSDNTVVVGVNKAAYAVQ